MLLSVLQGECVRRLGGPSLLDFQEGCVMPENSSEESRDQLDEARETEPWEGWETKLVVYSIAIGIAVLIVGGLLVNHFIL